MIRPPFFLFLLLALPAMAFGQTQQGYVKTLGRGDRAGEPLGGVTVRVKGEHNAALSRDDGTFSFVLAGRKNGDAYVLQQVRKQGYELNEQGVIGRQQAFSDHVPLTLVMVNTAELQAEKLRIEKRAFETAERNYKSRLALLERQLSEQRITTESYREQLQQLQQNFEKYQGLIAGLAEHYAHVDYDDLSDQEREITQCIESGRLERADSLIRTLFDPTDVLKRNQEALSRIDQQEAEAHQLLDQANADMAAVLRQQEKDAEHLYQLYTIALSRFDNDKARHYIETRAALDTTNADWQNQAGRFLHEYTTDYDAAMTFYQRALTVAAQGDHHHRGKAGDAYCNISLLHLRLDHYDDAEKAARQAISTYREIYGDTCRGIVEAYNALGRVYSMRGDYRKALTYEEKAMDMARSVEADIDWSTLYNNIGGEHINLGNIETALIYYRQSLEACRRTVGLESSDAAIVYQNMAVVHLQRSHAATYSYSKAIDYLNHALDIEKRIYGPEHPNLAGIYESLAAVFNNHHSDYEKAMEYHRKSLAINEKVFGPDHINLTNSLTGIGTVYLNQKEYVKALLYLSRAQHLNKTYLPANHPLIKQTEKTIDLVCDEMADALAEEDVKAAALYHELARLHMENKDYAKALSNTQEALQLRLRLLGEEHTETAKTLNNMGSIYFALGDYDKARQFYDRALRIFRKTAGDDDEKTKFVEGKIRLLEETVNTKE